jgi:aminoglycoside phosphotransferase (APT) family kinase protein
MKDEGVEKFGGTKDVADTHKFNEQNLEDYMAAHVEGFEGPLEVRQFKGGQSNPTYQLVTPNKKYVMRRKPPGKLLPSAHAVDREYKVITALGSIDFPVPRTYCLCKDESVVGTMFYIMDMVEGRILWDPLLPDLPKEGRRAIFEAKIKTLADLHNADYKAIGLGDFGKEGEYFERQISRWTKQYQLSETQEITSMNKLIDWLPGNIPGNDEVSIVHGDFRLDNMVLHQDKPQVAAVLDWELSTLGHPLGDFTYHLMQWYMPSDAGSTNTLKDADFDALNIPDAEEYTRLYCAHTGRDSIENMDFYIAYNMFRLAGILQGIVGSVRDGTASNAHAAAMADRVKPLSDMGWEYALRAGAV